MLYRLLSLFLSDKILSKLSWVSKLGACIKVHAAPLLGGAGFGLAGFTLQQSGTVKVNFDFLANQTLLDSICSAYAVCGLDVTMGAQVLASLLLAVVSAYVMERFYVAESPNSKFLVSINVDAEKVVDIINEVSGTNVVVLKDQSPESK